MTDWKTDFKGQTFSSTEDVIDWIERLIERERKEAVDNFKRKSFWLQVKL